MSSNQEEIKDEKHIEDYVDSIDTYAIRQIYQDKIKEYKNIFK